MLNMERIGMLGNRNDPAFSVEMRRWHAAVMSHPCVEYFPNQEVLHPQAVTIHTRGSNRRDESQVARLASAVPFEMYFPVCPLVFDNRASISEPAGRTTA